MEFPMAQGRAEGNRSESKLLGTQQGGTLWWKCPGTLVEGTFLAFFPSSEAY